MISNTGIPELKEWSDIDFSDWWRKHASNPFAFFAGRCPHCGAHDSKMIVKYRDMVDGYDGKVYEVVESTQVVCKRCQARGGLYRREVINTAERPKSMSHDTWSMIQNGIGFWNMRH